MNMKNLMKAPTDLSEEEIMSSVKFGVKWLVIFATLTLAVAVVFAALPLDPETSRFFLAQASVRVKLSNIFLNSFTYILSFIFAFFTFQIFENSKTGRRIDNSALIFVGFMIATALVFGSK